MMGWRVVERRIGKAGPLRQRTARQREWDVRYGEGNWEIGYVIEGVFLSQEDALETIYYRSYEQHFREHPADHLRRRYDRACAWRTADDRPVHALRGFRPRG